MFIGNIVTKSFIKPHDKFNVVDSLDKIIEGLPTLIIGWEIVKTIDSDADYSNRVLSDNIRWTFTLSEKRNLYEEDLYYFIKYCYDNLVSKVTYKYVDFILNSDDDIADTFKNIKKSEKKVAFKNESMIYIYTPNNIFGVDLNIIEFVDRKSDKLIEYLKSFIPVFLMDSNILIEYKDYMDMLNNETKYIPYLYSIENE